MDVLPYTEVFFPTKSVLSQEPTCFCLHTTGKTIVIPVQLKAEKGSTYQSTRELSLHTMRIMQCLEIPLLKYHRPFKHLSLAWPCPDSWNGHQLLHLEFTWLCSCTVTLTPFGVSLRSVLCRTGGSATTTLHGSMLTKRPPQPEQHTQHHVPKS